jgi:hypothetical protein
MESAQITGNHMNVERVQICEFICIFACTHVFMHAHECLCLCVYVCMSVCVYACRTQRERRRAGPFFVDSDCLKNNYLFVGCWWQ